MSFRGRKHELRLGVRGQAQTGPHAGQEVFFDSVGMTPVDPLAILVSPDLNADHPDQLVLWVNPEDLDVVLRSWKVSWGEQDDAVADRLQSLIG